MTEGDALRIALIRINYIVSKQFTLAHNNSVFSKKDLVQSLLALSEELCSELIKVGYNPKELLE